MCSLILVKRHINEVVMTRIIATKVVPRASALGSNGAFYVDKGERFTLTRLLTQGSA